MGSKNRCAKAVQAALAASNTSQLPVWEVTNTRHLIVEYGSTSAPATSTQVLHVALAACDPTLCIISLPSATSMTSIAATPAQAQSLQEIEPALLWEIKASARCRGHEVGLKEGQCVRFQEGMEAGMKKGIEQGQKEGHQEGWFTGFRDGYQAGQLEVSQALCAPSYPHTAIANPACDAAPTSIFAVDAVNVLEDTTIARDSLQIAPPTLAPLSPTPTATICDIAAVPLPTSTSPAPVLATTVALADSPAARDLRNPTPAPTQQPHEANTSNARSTPSASSIMTHTTSASSGDEPASLSHPTPTSMTACKPDRPPVATEHEPREVRSTIASPAPSTALSASHPHIATLHDTSTSCSNSPLTFVIAREPTRPPPATNRESRKVPAVNTHAAPTTSTASLKPTVTPHGSRPLPDRPIRPSAMENETKEGSGPHTKDVRTVSNAQGGHADPVCTPAPPASRTRGMTPHGMPGNPAAPHTHLRPQMSHDAAGKPARMTSTPNMQGSRPVPHHLCSTLPSPPLMSMHQCAPRNNCRCPDLNRDSPMKPPRTNHTKKPHVKTRS